MTSDIKRWMWRNVERFLDSCGEVNATAMVEAWDHECSTGEATLDSEHEAWTIAVDVALAHERRLRAEEQSGWQERD